MRVPDSLATLIDDGIIEEVLRPLMSGKEAQVFLVLSGGQQRVAKVYKQVQQRSFRQRSEYTEGRKVRNSRDQRAMEKHSRHGRDQDEAAWTSAEVDAIYRLRAAGVRVPTPYHFVDGVLIMELITDSYGNPAPRLGDVPQDRDNATRLFKQLLAEVVRMLCAGIVHGDLSDFNVLLGADGPVLIDFPQAVNASSNQNARKLLLRDVDNLHRYLARFVPGGAAPPYAQEMWHLYQRGELTPETPLSGRYRAAERPVNTKAVLALVSEAAFDHQQEQRRRGQPAPGRRGGAQQPPPKTPLVEMKRQPGQPPQQLPAKQPHAPHPHHVQQHPAAPHPQHGQPPRNTQSQPQPRSQDVGDAGQPRPGKRRRRRRRNPAPNAGHTGPSNESGVRMNSLRNG